MNKVSLTLQARQILASSEMKLNVYRNEVIINDYKERVKSLEMLIATTTYNRSDRARLLRLLALVCPVQFPEPCKRDAESLKQHLINIKRRIPSLV